MKNVYVWDPLVRLFHWSTALLFVANLTVIDDQSQAHLWAGYILFGIVLSRLVWGFVGTRNARFRTFWPSRSGLVAHIRSMVSGEPDRHLSHNPLGALMVFNLLATLVMIAVTGIALQLGGAGAPGIAEGLHEFFANYAAVCVGLHIAGVLFESRRGGTNLIRAMITGRKTVPEAVR